MIATVLLFVVMIGHAVTLKNDCYNAVICVDDRAAVTLKNDCYNIVVLMNDRACSHTEE